MHNKLGRSISVNCEIKKTTSPETAGNVPFLAKSLLIRKSSSNLSSFTEDLDGFHDVEKTINLEDFLLLVVTSELRLKLKIPGNMPRT